MEIGANFSDRRSLLDAPILYIVGADDPEKLKIEGRRFQVAGSSDIYKLLGPHQPFHRLQMTANYFRQAKRPDLAGYNCFLNLITEPEGNDRVLDNLRKLLRGVPGKVVNRPEAVVRSTRDQVARLLSGIDGLRVPRAVGLRKLKPDMALRSIEGAGVRYPVILRETGTHTGRIVGCFDGPAGLGAALGRGEYIATEFVDFRSADGVYRKYRVFFIGSHILFRHMLASDEWNVHAKDRRRYMLPRPELLEEEKALFDHVENPFGAAVMDVLKAVRGRMALDYFGMDFGIAPDGQVVLFEANATMNFFPFLPDPEFAYVQACLAPAQAAFRELVGLAADVRPAR